MAATHALNGYRRYHNIRRRVPFFRACPELQDRAPQLRLAVCDALDVDCGGNERGVKSDRSFICRSEQARRSCGRQARGD
jgi:hypothetical protein